MKIPPYFRAVLFGAFLILHAAPARAATMHDALLDVFESPTFTLNGNRSDGITAGASSAISGSAWTLGTADEQAVYLARIRFNYLDSAGATVDNRSYKIGIGKGGQIYSIRGDFGEAVPPQFRSIQSGTLYPRPANFSKWNDDVFETVVTCAKKNDGDYPPLSYHIHQSGNYIRDEYPNILNGPTLASGVPDNAPNSFVVVSWGQQALIPTRHESRIIYTSRYRNVGSGILEVTTSVYNYSWDTDIVADTQTNMSAPWANVRTTTFGALYVPDQFGTLQVYDRNPNGNNPLPAFDGSQGGLPITLNSTAGWFMWSKVASGTSPALGVVVGTDSGASVVRDSILRIGYVNSLNAPANKTETQWRNFSLSCIQRYPEIQGGDFATYRYFLVFNTKNGIPNVIQNQNLASKTFFTVQRFGYNANSAQELVWYRNAAGALSNTLQSGYSLFLRSWTMPKRDSVSHTPMRPVYYLKEVATQNKVVTYNPYYFQPYENVPEINENLNNPNKDDPVVNTHYGLHVYDGKTEYLGFLGYADPTLYPLPDYPGAP